MESERLKLRSLRHWLGLSGMSGVLIISAAVVQLANALIALCLIAIGFSFYILRSLIELKRKGWAIAYGITIGIPFVIALVLSGSETVGVAIWFFPLAMFYAYCWLLRYSIIDWLSDLGDVEAFELDNKDEKKYKDILDRFQ
jgi:hypothetical protein